MPGYQPFMRSIVEGYSPEDAALVKLPAAACEFAKNGNVPTLDVCSESAKENSAFFLMSHRTENQHVVYADPSSSPNIRRVRKKPYNDNDSIIMQGDSGGPLVVARNGTTGSEPNNWACIHGVASTAFIRDRDGASSYANYAAGPNVLDWIHTRSEQLRKTSAINSAPGSESPTAAAKVELPETSYDSSAHAVQADFVGE
jgi:hypothetical protein